MDFSSWPAPATLPAKQAVRQQRAVLAKKTRKVWKPNLQPMTVMVGGQSSAEGSRLHHSHLKKWEREEAAKHAHGAHKPKLLLTPPSAVA
jgi:hypothetical protein